MSDDSTSAASSARGYTRLRPNRCLTACERRGRLELPVDVTSRTPATEISWLEPYPDMSPETQYLPREGLEPAFVAVLQRLSAIQLAVLILREGSRVLGSRSGPAARHVHRVGERLVGLTPWHLLSWQLRMSRHVEASLVATPSRVPRDDVRTSVRRVASGLPSVQDVR